jgi:hypothetical protein
MNFECLADDIQLLLIYIDTYNFSDLKQTNNFPGTFIILIFSAIYDSGRNTYSKHD